MRQRITEVEPQRPLKLLLRCGPVILVVGLDKSQYAVSRGQGIIQGYCPSRCILGLGHCLRGSDKAGYRRQGVRARERCISAGVIRIHLDCMLELFNASRGTFFVPQVPGLLLLQIRIMRKSVHMWRVEQSMLSLSREPEPNLACNGARDFALHFQNVADVAVLTVGPDV